MPKQIPEILEEFPGKKHGLVYVDGDDYIFYGKHNKGSCSIFECSNKECPAKWKREKDGQYKLTADHTHPPETKDVRDRRALKAKALAKAAEAALARTARAAEAALARSARASHAGTPDDQPSTSNRNDARPANAGNQGRELELLEENRRLQERWEQSERIIRELRTDLEKTNSELQEARTQNAVAQDCQNCPQLQVELENSRTVNSTRLALYHKLHDKNKKQIADLEKRLEDVASESQDPPSQLVEENAELKVEADKYWENAAKELQTTSKSLEEQLSAMKISLETVGEDLQKANETVEALNETIASLENRMEEDKTQIEELHDKIVDLQGAVRVICRFRSINEDLPRFDKKFSADHRSVTLAKLIPPGPTQPTTTNNRLLVNSSAAGSRISISRTAATRTPPTRTLATGTPTTRTPAAGTPATRTFGPRTPVPPGETFTLNRVFGETVSQEEMFHGVLPIVKSAVAGYNALILSYGQTGSGKTYTMKGGKPGTAEEGIMSRSVSQIFADTSREIGWTYTISVSFMELYDDKAVHLPDQKPLTVRINNDEVLINGLQNVPLKDVQHFHGLYEEAMRKRVTRPTALNGESSRSHFIVTVTIDGLHTATGKRSNGKLTMVDLGGSENIKKSGVAGEGLAEANFINNSLMELGKLIRSCKGQKVGPKLNRNSILTQVLHRTLSGTKRPKILIIVNVSPDNAHYDETKRALQWGVNATNCSVGVATN